MSGWLLHSGFLLSRTLQHGAHSGRGHWPHSQCSGLFAVWHVCQAWAYVLLFQAYACLLFQYNLHIQVLWRIEVGGQLLGEFQDTAVNSTLRIIIFQALRTSVDGRFVDWETGRRGKRLWKVLWMQSNSALHLFLWCRALRRSGWNAVPAIFIDSSLFFTGYLIKTLSTKKMKSVKNTVKSSYLFESIGQCGLCRGFTIWDLFDNIFWRDGFWCSAARILQTMRPAFRLVPGQNPTVGTWVRRSAIMQDVLPTSLTLPDS